MCQHSSNGVQFHNVSLTNAAGVVCAGMSTLTLQMKIVSEEYVCIKTAHWLHIEWVGVIVY